MTARSGTPGSREPIVVVYGVDNRFALPLAASIQSALDNLSSDRRLDVQVIDGGLSPRSRARVLESLAGRPAHLTWLAPKGHAVSSLKVGGAITVATYYRLLIPQLLPAHDKAIYLDADLIVEGDLAALWDVPLDDRHVLAVQDQGVREISGPFGLTNYRALGIPAGRKYFNAGVLVMNLAKWRRRGTAETILRYVREQHEHIRFHDQDGLNAVLWDDWKELDPRWNQMPQILQVKTAGASPFAPETFERLVRQPYIVHFASADKPWSYGCRHPATPRFFHYVDRTGFRGFRPSRAGRLLERAVGTLRRVARLVARMVRPRPAPQ